MSNITPTIVKATALTLGISMSFSVIRRRMRYRRCLAAAERLLLTFVARKGDRSSIHIADMDATMKKCATLLMDGADSLSLTMDWDRTITAGKSVSSHGVLETCEALGESFRSESAANTNKYLPIEQNAALSISEKIPHMKNWYRLNHAAIIKCGIYRSMLESAVQSAFSSRRLIMRQGALKLLCRAKMLQIPVLIFSAGLADIIDIALRQCAPDISASVVSNRMLWSSDNSNRDEEKLVGFSEPLIFMFNKKMEAVPANLQPKTRRCNAIVVGDSLGDATMADGAISPPKTILRVGFLNYPDSERHLPKYNSTFDIVLVEPSGEHDMEPITQLLDLINSRGLLASATADADI